MGTKSQKGWFFGFSCGCLKSLRWWSEQPSGVKTPRRSLRASRDSLMHFPRWTICISAQAPGRHPNTVDSIPGVQGRENRGARGDGDNLAPNHCLPVVVLRVPGHCLPRKGPVSGPSFLPSWGRGTDGSLIHSLMGLSRWVYTLPSHGTEPTPSSPLLIPPNVSSSEVPCGHMRGCGVTTDAF